MRVGPEHVDSKMELLKERVDVWDGFAEFGLVIGSRLELELNVPHLFVKVVQSLLYSVFFLGNIWDIFYNL